MFLKKTKTPKGRIFLQIAEGYRNEAGKTVHRVVEKLGYLDELNEKHEGKALQYYMEYAKKLTSSDRVQDNTDTPTKNKNLTMDESSLRNMGYLAVKPILRGLKIADLALPLAAKYKTKPELISNVFEFLIYSKIIDSSSKISSYRKKSQYFENYTFSEDSMYRCLSYLGDSYESIKDFLFRSTQDNYGLDLSKSYYDGTNFYFEIDYENDFQRRGPSKENRKEPLVSIGLLLDANYLPIDFCIYPGNESEKPHYGEVIKEMKEKNKITNRTIYIADKGLNCGQNIFNVLQSGDGYIYSQSIRGASEVMKKYIINETGFTVNTDKYGNVIRKIKGFVDDEAKISFTIDGKKITHTCRQKQVVTWSQNYADKTRIERGKLLKKAQGLINSPKEFDRKRIGDASNYIKKLSYNSDGEIVEEKSILALDTDKIHEEEILDGYYLIVTSEVNMKSEDIVKAYRNLSNIEQSFRVEKHYLKLRPVYLTRVERIKAHVLISYISLLVLRILERKILKDRFPIEEIIDSLKDFNCAALYQNIYFVFKYDRVISALGELSNSNVILERQTLSAIKKMFKY